ncbi:MAG TPA: hypothetical protein VK656_03170, partial [Candidatus Acidoferrum sp.]|nr:hypothetical protein [Candidatus Acidoferrum sp.]
RGYPTRPEKLAATPLRIAGFSRSDRGQVTLVGAAWVNGRLRRRRQGIPAGRPAPPVKASGRAR